MCCLDIGSATRYSASSSRQIAANVCVYLARRRSTGINRKIFKWSYKTVLSDRELAYVPSVHYFVMHVYN